MFSQGPHRRVPPEHGAMHPPIPHGAEHCCSQHGPQAGEDGGDDDHIAAAARGCGVDGAQAAGWKGVGGTGGLRDGAMGRGGIVWLGELGDCFSPLGFGVMA